MKNGAQKLLCVAYAPCPAALSLRSGRLTAIKRKNPRLGFFPNFFRFAPETSLNRDVPPNKRELEVISPFIEIII